MDNTRQATDDTRQATTRRRELEQEQAYVSMLYGRVDRLRARTRARLAQALGQDGGTRQTRLDRDTLVARHSDRLAQLAAAEHGLCFGRLDHRDGSRRYVGRLGLLDDEGEPLLVDWRAPAALPFYRATPVAPDGVVRRRHLRTRNRVVVGIDDDALDLDALSQVERGGLSGEAALLASLTSSRTGRMGNIVATIQAEQDRVIRAGLPGILVVQGGPGTGKTAVALHRAAYLLYTHRERLARRGVLVVGPNQTFLRYIEQVLPSLGETDVLLSTVDALYPGVRATGREPVAAATVKGDLRMAEVLAAAVRQHQQVPDGAAKVEVDGHVLVLDRAACEQARRRARAAGTPHNQARRVFESELLGVLARELAGRLTADLPDVDLPDDDLINDDVPNDRLLDDELADIGAELAARPAVRALLDRLWPRLTPQQLLAGLFASPARLAAAAPGLGPAERAALAREPLDGADPDAGGWWTPADVPLLDEAAVLLGEDDRGAARAAVRDAEQEERELAYARGVLEIFGSEDHPLDPALLADRYRRIRADSSIAERAAQDRAWTFGHVIVDEAQEVSAMAWRMLMRRCPTRSMTVVGDLAQTGAPWGARSWTRVLDPHAAGRWREARLTVNYRTPEEIMAVAAEVLATVAADLEPPRSVRQAGVAPWSLQADAAALAGELAAVAAAEAAAVGDGKLAVLVPAGRAEELGRPIAAAVPGTAVGPGPAALDAPVAVLTVAEAKGLEFDAVVVVEPGAILGESPRGASDLYVALTRTTRRLGVVHTGPLPAVLAGLAPRR
jgi:DNA helicase IV